VQRDAPAGDRHDLRDPSAHLSGTDDEHMLELHDAGRYRRPVPAVDVNGARLWYDEAGDGEAVVLLHGGLGDSGLWEPVVPFLAERFRTIRTDLRFFGRSTGPVVPWSWQEDTVGVLDALGLERAAVVGLSMGGKLALDVALAHPDRLWAVVGVAPGLGGHDSAAYSEEQGARYEAAEAEGDLDAAMAIDFEVWAPLGTDDRIRELWHATPDANPLPPGLEPVSPSGAPANERLAELVVPVLVVTAAHDPAGMREIGPLVAREAPNARHVELDSDHYVTLREPELVARTLLDFLDELSPTAPAR
jgi:3-oxoadipate enol-lactonase